MPNKFAQTLYKINLLRNFIFRPLTLGVRAIVLNEENEILLVKHTYLNGWFLPGGRVDKGETLQEAIKRELEEELAITDIDVKGLHWVYSSVKEYKNDHIILFECQTNQTPQIASREIEAAQFFSLTQLPDGLTPATLRRVKEFIDGLEKPERW